VALLVCGTREAAHSTAPPIARVWPSSKTAEESSSRMTSSRLLNPLAQPKEGIDAQALQNTCIHAGRRMFACTSENVPIPPLAPVRRIGDRSVPPPDSGQPGSGRRGSASKTDSLGPTGLRRRWESGPAAQPRLREPGSPFRAIQRLPEDNPCRQTPRPARSVSPGKDVKALLRAR